MKEQINKKIISNFRPESSRLWELQYEIENGTGIYCTGTAVGRYFFIIEFKAFFYNVQICSIAQASKYIYGMDPDLWIFVAGSGSATLLSRVKNLNI